MTWFKAFPGVGYMLVSSIAFAIVNLCVKYLHHMPVNELVFFRSVISLSICLFYIKKLQLPLFGVNKKWLLGRGIFGTSALTLFFFTIKGIPIASATTVQYLSPIFTVIVAMILFKERVKRTQWYLFGIAFCGVILMRGFNTNVEAEFYILLGVVSAFLSGIAYNCIIKCKATDHTISIVMYFPLVAIPIMGVWSLFSWVQPVGYEWLLLLFIGCLTQIAQVSMTKALHAAPSARIMPIKYIGAIWAILIGFFVFDERLSILTYVGMAIVITAVIVNIIIGKKKERIVRQVLSQ